MSCPYFFSQVGPSKPKENSRRPEIVWKLFLGDSSSLGKIVGALEIAGCKADVKAISNVTSSENILTPRQQEVMAAALMLGHFDFPRRIGLTELAEKLSVKSSTLSEILRRAEAKIVQHHMETV